MATLHLDTTDVMKIENIKQYIMQTFQINVQVVNDTFKSPKKKSILSDELDQEIREAKPINTTEAQKMKKTFEELNALLDPAKKDLFIGEAREQYYNDKANQV